MVARVLRAKTNDDRITMLPDALIHHILSFLDMIYAVRTCILSRRWSRLWVSLPTLNFDFDVFINSAKRPRDYDYDSRFSDFVDQVFIHRDGSNIKRFSFNYTGGGQWPVIGRLYSWVLACVRHNILELDLHISSDYYINLPLCLFTSENLTEMTLDIGSYQLTPTLVIDLPRLRKLHLKSVDFPLYCACSPFDKCPLLEYLDLSGCSFTMEDTVNISVPSLKHLRIDSGSEVFSKVKISAPSLISLFLERCLHIEYSSEGFPMLLSAQVGISKSNGYYSYASSLWFFDHLKEECPKRMIQLLQTVHNVRALSLPAWSIEVVSEHRLALKRLSTQFLNLRSMHLESWLSSRCIHGILYLLEISPNMETLILEVTKKLLGSTDEEWEEAIANVEDKEFLEIGPCIFSHLKYFEIRGMRGWVNELKLLEILLKKSIVLERLVFIFTSKEQMPEQERNLIEFSKKILSFPRASSSIAILFF